MSSFKSSAIVVSNKSTSVTPTISGDLSIVARNDHLQVYNGLVEQQLPYYSDIVATSGDLAILVNNEAIARANADSLLTPLTTTSSISGGLNGRLVTVEGNYATKATPVAGTYNNVIVNSQGIVTSGGNVTYSATIDLSGYTLLSTTQGVSATLNTSINNANIFRAAGDLALQTEVNNITGGNFVLDTRYSKTTDITTISGGLNTAITNETIFRVAGDLALQSEINNITGSSFVLDSRYSKTSDIAVISGGLNTSINNEALARSNADALLTPLTTTSSISGGFNIRIGTLETNTSGITGGIAQIDSTFVKLVGGNFIYGDQTIFGNINLVSGGINQVTVADLNVEDQYVLVNSDVTGSPILDGGLKVNRGNTTDSIIKWNEATDKWQAGLEGSEQNIAYTNDLTPYTLLTTTASISGDLNLAINNEALARSNADALLTPLTTTANISGGLNGRLVTVENNYATKATPVAGTYNNVVVNSEGIVTSGGNVVYSPTIDLSGYTLLSTTQGVSATLNTSITNETIFRVAGDLALQTEINNITGSSFVLDTRYSKTTDISVISGGLNTSITNETIFRTAYDSALQTEINNITGGSFVLDGRYAKSSDISVISGGLSTSITNETIFRVAGDLALQTEVNNITGSSFVLDNRYSKTSDITVISGGLNIAINNEALARSNADSLLTPLTTTSSISGGLNGRLVTVENNYATKSTPVAGTYNNVVVNSQGIVTSGGNVVYSPTIDLSGYTLLSTTQGVSATLNTSITNETIFRVAGDLALQTQVNNITGANFVLDNRYTKTSDIVVISGGLNLRLANVENKYATKSSTLAGNYEKVIVNSEGIVTSGGNYDYALSSSLSNYALDSGVVHKTGVETISGIKTFTSTVAVAGAISGAEGQFSFTSSTDKELFNIVYNGAGVGTNTLVSMRSAASTGNNSGKVFGIFTYPTGTAYGMFYSDGKYGIGPGSTTRDIYFSRAGVNKFRISNIDGSNNPTAGELYVYGDVTTFLGGGLVADSLNSSLSGNLLTWNDTKKLVDSGISSSTITTINNNYATKATPVAGTYEKVIVNSQGIVTSGGYFTYTTPSDLNVYTLLSTTQGVSATLNTSITNETIFRAAGDLALQTEINNITGGSFVLDNRYSKTSDIVTISGGLNGRLTTVENNYATKATPIAGTYNNVVVNSQGIVTSGGNVTYSAIVDLSGYTLLSTTQGVSATLNTSINNEALARSNADALLTPLTTTANISGGLNGRLVTVEGNYATKASPAAGTYNRVVVNTQGIVTSGGIDTYNIIAGTNVQVNQSPLNTYTVSVSGDLGRIVTLGSQPTPSTLGQKGNIGYYGGYLYHWTADSVVIRAAVETSW